jgi:hypothetical protein
VDKPLLFDEEQTTGRKKKKGEKKGEKEKKDKWKECHSTFHRFSTAAT